MTVVAGHLAVWKAVASAVASAFLGVLVAGCPGLSAAGTSSPIAHVSFLVRCVDGLLDYLIGMTVSRMG